MTPSLYEIRTAHPADEAFLYSTWLLGLRHGNEMFSLIPKEIYYEKYKVVLQALLKSSKIKVACLKEDSDVILGYIVFSGTRLHWIFVKKPWRKLGIARALICDLGLDSCSHITKLGKTLKPKEWIFNPFL